MKILNVNMSIDPVTGGGTAERTFQMSRFLTKAGEKCTILTTDLGITPERLKDLEGTKIVALPSLYNRFYMPKFSFRQVKNIVEGADIIHIMNHWTFLNVLVYFIARYLKKPYVVCPAGALLVCGRSKFSKRLYNWFVGKKIIQNASGYIAVTANEISQFHAYGINAEKVSVIPNGINPKDFQVSDEDSFRRKYGLMGCFFILFVGRLNYIKGPDLLLRSFCNIKDKFQDDHLVDVGPDGGMLSDLKKIVSEQCIGNRVHFIGYLGGAEKSQVYHAADLLVIPSRQEGMSIVALEAGITGKPILITDKCGFDEIASIGGGQVVPASVEGLQEGLVELLKEPAQLKSMGANLKKFICEHFIWDSVINEYLNLYRKILRMEEI